MQELQEGVQRAVRHSTLASQALTEDGLTTRQHHSQSPSGREKNILEATEEPLLRRRRLH